MCIFAEQPKKRKIMSLIQCKYCGNLISEHAPLCPRCGHSVSTPKETEDNYTVFSNSGSPTDAASSAPAPASAPASSSTDPPTVYEGPRRYEEPTSYEGTRRYDEPMQYDNSTTGMLPPQQDSSFTRKFKAFLPYLIGFFVVVVIMIIIAMLMKLI